MVEQKKATIVEAKKPVVEEVVHKEELEVREHKTIHEKHLRADVEYHRQPIVKEVEHAPIIRKVEEQSLREENEEKPLTLPSTLPRLDIKEDTKVTVKKEAPTIEKEERVAKVVVTQPVIKEIHKQPIVEVHEQKIERVIHEAPRVHIIEDQPVSVKVKADALPEEAVIKRDVLASAAEKRLEGKEATLQAASSSSSSFFTSYEDERKLVLYLGVGAFALIAAKYFLFDRWSK